MSEPAYIGAEQALSSASHESKLRRWVACTAVCLGSAALGAGIGAVVGMERPTQTTLAGNEATADPHIGSDVNDVDLGIIGARIPSKKRALGIPIAATVRLDATKPYDTTETPDEEILPGVLQTFSDIDHETDKIVSDITWHIARDSRNGAVAGLVVFAAGLAGYIEHKRARNHMSAVTQTEMTLAYQPLVRKLKIVAGTLALLPVATAGAYGTTRVASASGDITIVNANPAFDGTALEGAEIVGLAAPLVDSAVPMVERYITENDSYYRELDQRFKGAFEEYRQSAELPEGERIVPILLVSDRHCNIGMDRVVAAAAKAFEAQAIVSGGDDNFWGSFSFEAACTAGLQERSEALGIDFVVGFGNHDTHGTNNPAYEQGIIVIDGETQTIKTKGEDITFLSKPDPRRSEFGQEIEPESPEDQLAAVTEQGLALGTLACNSEAPVDILIAHDRRAAEIATANGCGNINFTLSGHSHHRSQVTLGANGAYHYTEGTTGSAPSEQPSYGPLKTDAQFSVLYYYTVTNKPVGMVYITTSPEKDVKISDFVPIG